MEKARSLLEAEANLDERGEEPGDPGGPHSPTPSGFVPASASQSGFSPARTLLGDGDGPQSKAALPSESGVFAGGAGVPTGNRLVDSLQGALGAASRNEAGLGSLQRAIRDASRAFTASRQAQEALTEELRVMHRGLNELMSEKAAVERYAALLTQERDAALDAAEEARREAKRDREFLLREQDRFIQLLLEEHEAELQQLRRSLSPARGRSLTGVDAAGADVAPSTVPGLAPSALDEPVEGRRSSPPGEAFGERRSSPPGEPIERRRSSPPGELSGAALARQVLANTPPSNTLPAGIAPAEPARAVPLPGDQTTTGSAEAPRDGEERMATYPPAPAVLDLDSLAAEVDGNSERPPPIRRLGLAEPKVHLNPARVPTQLYDTMVSPIGELDPNRKG